MADRNTDIFAPPSDIELEQVASPSKKKFAGSADMFSPPTAEEVNSAMFAPPSQAELGNRDSIEREIEDRSFFNRPALGAEYTTPAEIAQIASKHGVDPKELESLAPYFGARIEGSDFLGAPEVKRAAGMGGSVLLNIPQKLYKKYRGGEMEKALDELQSLASGRQSYLQLGGEIAIPGVGIGSRAATTAGRVAGAAATGAVAGAAGAPAGKELEGAAFGTAVGGAAGAISERLAGRLRRSTVPQVERAVAEDVLSRQAPEIEVNTERLLSRRAESEKAIEAAIRGQELDAAAIRKITDEQVPEETLAKFLDPSTDEGQLIRKRIGSDSEEAIRSKLAQDVVEQRAVSFAEDLTKERPTNLESARKSIFEYADRQGEQATLDRYKLFTEEQAALDYIKESGARAGRGDNFQDKTLNFLSDAQFVLRDIDERFGTGLESAHRAMNRAYNRMSFARNDFRENIARIYEASRAIDKELVEGGKVYQALDTGDVSQLNRQEREAYSQFKQLFSEGLNYVNKLVKERDPGISPLNIPARENYVPHILLAPEEIASKFEQVVGQASKEVGSSLADLNPAAFRRALDQSPSLRELVKGVAVFDNRSASTGQELLSRIRDLLDSREGKLRMETAARAALERQGYIPEWLREKNLYRLADRWASNTLKHLYLRKQVDTMRSLARRIETAGGDLEAGYVQKLLQDIGGIRKGTAAELGMQKKLDYMKSLDKWAEGRGVTGKAVASIAKALPEVFSDMNRQIYPNLLGLSPRALLMNSTQLWTKTAPELGGPYGYQAVMRSAFNVAANPSKYIEKVRELGLQPADFVRKYSRPMAEGIRRNALYAIPNEMLNKLGDASMYLYTKLDTMNRAIGLGVADVMANDLARGSDVARKALQKFPASLRRDIAKATSTDEVRDLLATHLNASTQYNYNRLSMSEFGRTMGPLFSTFSKWPTATAGELVQEFRNKGALRGGARNLEKFVVPLVLLQLADIAMFGYDPEKPWQENQEEKSDRAKKIFGVAGLSQSAPIGAAQGILKGDFFTPPVVDAAIKGIVIPSMEQDGDKIIKGLDTAIQNFTPGSVYVRFLTDDLVTLMTGERPEGSTFIERSAEGARRLGK